MDRRERVLLYNCICIALAVSLSFAFPQALLILLILLALMSASGMVLLIAESLENKGMLVSPGEAICRWKEGKETNE